MPNNNSNIPFVRGLAEMLDGIGVILENGSNLQCRNSVVYVYIK